MDSIELYVDAIFFLFSFAKDCVYIEAENDYQRRWCGLFSTNLVSLQILTIMVT